MIYADYIFYKNEFLGKAVSEENFDSLALRATIYINYVTFNNIKEVTDEVRNATCAIAECMVEKNISSESVGEYSVTYSNKHTDIYSIAKQYLPEKLMYRGV